MREFVIKKCIKCGAIVKVLEDCHCGDCGIRCCGEEMKALVPNSVDAAVEKHVPTYEVTGDRIKVTVNHVMDDDHYVEWIAISRAGREGMVYFKPGEVAECEFEYEPGSKLYAYCNKHGLWECEVK